MSMKLDIEGPRACGGDLSVALGVRPERDPIRVEQQAFLVSAELIEE